MAVVNFPPRQIGPFMSEVLRWALIRMAIVLAAPDQDKGARLV
jgi:hypothetical protein